jgi:hypothetical protein
MRLKGIDNRGMRLYVSATKGDLNCLLSDLKKVYGRGKIKESRANGKNIVLKDLDGKYVAIISSFERKKLLDLPRGFNDYLIFFYGDVEKSYDGLIDLGKKSPGSLRPEYSRLAFLIEGLER